MFWNIEEQEKENRILNTEKDNNDITVEELKNGIRKLKTGKAQGHKITSEMVKVTSETES